MVAVVPPLGEVFVGIKRQYFEAAALDHLRKHGRAGDLLAQLLAHPTAGVVDEQQRIFGLHAVERTRGARGERIAEIVGTLPEAVLRRHSEVVGRPDAFVFVVVGARQHGLHHRDIEFVVAQRGIGVVDHLLGEHREVVEHRARGGGAAHERIHRRGVGRTVGDQGHPPGIGLDHLCGIGLADEQGIGEIEAIPIVPAQVVALLFGREARRRDRREEHTGLRHAGRLLRPRTASAAGSGEEGQGQD